MVRVHRRKLLVASLLAALAACGAPAEDAADAPGTPDSLVLGAPEPATLLAPVPNGGPMPAADAAGGIPPYPGAIVQTRFPTDDPMMMIEAYTPDDWQAVAAFYQESLAGWRHVAGEDMVLFERTDGEAAITISPWDYQDLNADALPVHRDARTIIGSAWK